MKLNDILKGIDVVSFTGDLDREISFLTFSSFIRLCQ